MKRKKLSNRYSLFSLAFVFFVLTVTLGFLIRQNRELKDLLGYVDREMERSAREADRLETLAYSTGYLTRVSEDVYVHFGREKEFVVVRYDPLNIIQIDERTCSNLFRDRYFTWPPTAKLMKDEVHNKDFLIISQNDFKALDDQPSPLFSCIIDLDMKEERNEVAVYETPLLGRWEYTSFAGNGVLKLHLAAGEFYSSTSWDYLRLLEFIAYDPEEKKFVSVNHDFKAEFEKLLTEYDQIANKECQFRGKIRPVDEVLKIAGKNARCENKAREDEPYNECFITVGEFNKIMEDIQRVINGEEVSFLDHRRCTC